jgi:hypothetical protein
MGMPRGGGLTARKSKQTADRAEYATNAIADDNDGFRPLDPSRTSKAVDDKGFDRGLEIIYLESRGNSVGQY